MPAVAFVFQRDFRAEDNLGFKNAVESALKSGARLVPVFLMDDRQLDPERNPYRSDKCVRLMAECLAELSEDLRGMGWPGVVLIDIDSACDQLASGLGVTEVHHNADFTPYAAARDAGLAKALGSRGVRVVRNEEPEYTLWSTEDIRTKEGHAYKVYTPFVGACVRRGPPRGPDRWSAKPSREQRRPERARTHVAKSAAQRSFVAAFQSAASDRDAPRHRARALRTLKQVSGGSFASYSRTRNDFADWPENRGTTGLSVPMKFGRVSCREVYRSFEKHPALLGELMWREFYAHVAAGHPKVLAGQLTPKKAGASNRHELDHRDKAIDGWKHGPKQERNLRLWADGETGEPLVDAAMRNLKRTGVLHNRLRMVVASYLVKDLGVDWRRGEMVFARMLLDYDPASNGGGWRSMDAQAPGREIRPATQAEKHDRKGAYVRKWARSPGARSFPGGVGAVYGSTDRGPR